MKGNLFGCIIIAISHASPPQTPPEYYIRIRTTVALDDVFTQLYDHSVTMYIHIYMHMYSTELTVLYISETRERAKPYK